MGLLAGVAREARYLGNIARTLRRMRRLDLDAPLNAAELVERWATRKPDNVAIHYGDRAVTYRECDAAGNRYARWARSLGLGHGDVVSLVMENRPEFLFAWLGMAKLGVVTALINTNLRGRQLAHCVNVAGSDHVIVGSELAEPMLEARPLLDPPRTLWVTGGAVGGAEDLDSALSRADPGPLSGDERAEVKGRDNCFYIYTSGTTGYPKAANFSHYRVHGTAAAFGAVVRPTERDRMYVVLPLYHSAGGVIATSTVFAVGGSIVLRRRFSASEFWDDCAAYGVTMFQYIGELCRYLLNTPPHPMEREHRIRACIGNGLRPEIWTAFQERFAIPRIVEFYAATEGNFGLLNVDGRPGAVGRIPHYMDRVFNGRLVRFDMEAEAPVRDENGFCVPCGVDEVGEAIGRIPDDPGDAQGRFEGYTNPEATEKKILTDVFEQGDRWYRTGDLLRRDRQGYFYFVDRIGDTFRWKGENVATSEVAEVLSVHPGVHEANVYGVSVPGADGRAGMAAIVAGDDLDLDDLAGHLQENLPEYPQPLFLRLLPEIPVTGTFKHRKLDLVAEGYDPDVIADPLYFRYPESGRYVPLDRGLHDEIMRGEMRL